MLMSPLNPMSDTPNLPNVSLPVSLLGQARLFLQHLLQAGYSQAQIIEVLGSLQSQLIANPAHLTVSLADEAGGKAGKLLALPAEQGSKEISEQERLPSLSALSRQFVERLLDGGYSETEILDGLNQIAWLLIKTPRSGHVN